MAKKITSVQQHEQHIAIKEIAAPSTPANGYMYAYTKSDGKLYTKDDSGTEYILTPATGTSRLHVGTTAPGTPATGDLWVDTN